MQTCFSEKRVHNAICFFQPNVKVTRYLLRATPDEMMRGIRGELQRKKFYRGIIQFLLKAKQSDANVQIFIEGWPSNLPFVTVIFMKDNVLVKLEKKLYIGAAESVICVNALDPVFKGINTMNPHQFIETGIKHGYGTRFLVQPKRSIK